MTKIFIILLTALLVIIAISCRQNEQKVQVGQSNDDMHLSLGENLFKKHCQSCHGMEHIDETRFADVFKRLPKPSESNFIRFIRDSKGLKRSEGGYFRKLDDEFTSEYEHRFSDLTDEEINQLITIIKSRSW